MGTAGDDFEGAYFFGGSVGFFSQVTRRPPKAKSHFGSVYGERGERGEGGLCIVVWATSLSNFSWPGAFLSIFHF